MNLESAASINGDEQKISKWNAIIMKLTGVDPMPIALRDRVPPYWSLLPQTILDFLINSGSSLDDCDNYGKVELAVEGFLGRWKRVTMRRMGRA